jgi:hypothetical protein
MAEVFSALRTSLAELEQGRIDIAALVKRWQTCAAELPTQFSQALDPILMRLESSRLFDQDGCSFSRHEILDAMRHWLQQAEQVISKP